MLKKIHIKNYRGIEKLEIDDFKKINLFLGKNNSGKTTILEAISIGLTPNILPIFHILSFREIGLFADLSKTNLSSPKLWEDLEYLVHEKKTLEGFAIESEFDDSKSIKLEASFSKDVENFSKVQQGVFDFSFISHKQINSLIVSYTKDKKTVKLGLCRNGKYNDIGNFDLAEINMEAIQNRVIKAFELVDDPILSDLIKNNKEKEIVDILSEIDPKIKHLKIAGGEILFDIGEISLPLKYMGDGIIQILNILLKIHKAKNGILLIDEIENCLHWESQETMWKVVIKACKEFNVQIFASTHSKDIINSLAKIKHNFQQNNEDLVRVFRIEKQGNISRVIKYNDEMIDFATEQNREVR